MATTLLTTGAGATNNISIINPFPTPTGSTNMLLVFSIQTPNAGATIWQSQVADGTATGGNTRGGAGAASAIDFQKSRAAATQVASGSQAALFGGANNTCSANTSTVGGGFGNTVSANGAIMGGSGNTISATVGGQYNILGGSGNTINSTAGSGGAQILGGLNNTNGGASTTILGGYGQQARGYIGAMVWPTANPLALSSTNSLCQTVSMTTTASRSTIGTTTTTSDNAAISATNTLANSVSATTFIVGYAISSSSAANSARAFTYDMLVRKGATAATMTNIGGSAVTNIAGNLATVTVAKNVNTTTGSATVDMTTSAAVALNLNNFMIFSFLIKKI
jgi:hypothetical protein